MLMRRMFSLLAVLVALIALGAAPAFAQDGKLKVNVTPKHAYVFVDGKAIREGSQSIKLSAGKHTVEVVNYGYKPESKDVDVAANKTTSVDIMLTANGDKVSGPWGDIQVDGDPRAAVLLNGKKPDYFVGHVDEFNNDWIWHQNLLVPPGTHQVTVMRGDKVLFNGPVTVAANQKVTIHVSSDKTDMSAWKRGESLMKKSPLPRFTTGMASATVVVAPVKITSFSASNSQINCGQSSNLNWASQDAVDANITGGVGSVDPSGQKSVSPTQTTNYQLTATGPGGTATQSANVDVNTAIQATLSANPTELHYRKIGDKVIQQESSTLTWSTSNASTVSIDPFGSVDPNGTRTVQGVPRNQNIGPVDQTDTYALNATNVCGGNATQMASVHITGSIEPIPEVTLDSLFYPTDYPDVKHPDAGLLKSQQAELSTTADGFKKYLEYDPDAKLAIAAHADVRGSKNYNQDLTERRVTRIKEYLVSQGVPADKIQTAAYGKEQELSETEIKQLEMDNPNKAPARPRRTTRGNYLAYNRRVDVTLQPSGKKSTMFYPNNAPDVNILFQIPKPSLRVVEQNQ